MSVRVKFPKEQLLRAGKGSRERLQGDGEALLESLGVQLLSFVQLSYREKARGGVGDDGVQWKDITRETLAARVRRSGKGKKIVEQRKGLAKEIKQLLESAHRLRGKGTGWQGDKSTGVQAKVKKLRKKREDLLSKLNDLIDKAVASHEIGVDFGLQRASAAPGFSGSDGKGGNVLQKISRTDISVGFGREYSEYFDEKRTLIPDPLPDKWVEALQVKAVDWAEEVVQKELDDAGVS